MSPLSNTELSHDKLSNPEFQIGLTMSGAISAGAYTAGVFDFLIQALEEWERARNGKIPDVDSAQVPHHQVGIKVISGASAGAITAAIGVVALADAEQAPVPFTSPVAAGTQKIKCYLPKLYDTWVTKPALVADKVGDIDFLTSSDLDGPPNPEDDFSRTSIVSGSSDVERVQVVSLLNARLLDEIAKRGLDVQKLIDAPRPYIAEPLHIYMTLSNLRGVPYQVPFDGGAYHMISHGDRVHYAVTGIGAWESVSDFAAHDQKRDIAVAGLVQNRSAPDKTESDKWRDYAVCALASAAFPVGLAPRAIGATLGPKVLPNEYAFEYCGRRFPIENLIDIKTIVPSWLNAVKDARPFWFTTADGGIIDNDPFEYARFSLKDAGKLDLPIVPELDKVDRAVIMISPFPELKPIRPQGEPHSDIMSIVSALMPSLIDQARFKPSELALAAKEDHGSRYLIGPSRTTELSPAIRDQAGTIIKDAVEKEDRYAIASGLLGGFGGFVAHAFRDHDFQLGRRNCQRFLQASFALPANNKIVESWASDLDKEKYKAVASADDKDTSFYMILPLFGTAADEVALPKWPQISDGDLKTLFKRIAERFDRVAPKLVKQNVKGILGTLILFLLKPVIKEIPGLLRAKLLKNVELTIRADLVRRNQIQGWDLGNLPSATDLGADDIRLILAELINPAYDQRNVKGLLNAAIAVRPASPNAPVITADKIARLLDACKAAKGKPYEVWQAPWVDKNGDPVFTLTSRTPNLLERLISQTGLAFSQTVDPPGI